MILEKVESEGLAQLSYVIGDAGAGVCAVLDPRRDVEAYLEIARRNQVRIACILETHVHADFVSGSRELSARTGAPIRAGRSDDYGFEVEPLDEGDVVEVGSWRLTALHTPGHSPEHVCYALSAGDEEPWAVFSGDTLFAGSVGRPDLATGGEPEEMARLLWRSLQEKLLPMADGTVVFPGHGSGSPCGGSIGDRPLSTIGYERTHGEKLQARGEDEFVERVLDDLPEVPRYYSRMKRVNAEGSERRGPMPPLEPISPGAFRDRNGSGDAVVLDTRSIEAFAGAHVEGALNIALRTSFPVWSGWMLEPGRSVLLVVDDPRDVEVAQRHLWRIGIDDIEGYLKDGMRGWFEAGLPIVRREDWSVHELERRVRDGRPDVQVVDVRSKSEWEKGHLPYARHVYAPYLRERLDELDRDRPVVLYCGTGYRSSLAASVLERAGFAEVHSVPGSVLGWRAAGYPLVDGAGDGGRAGRIEEGTEREADIRRLGAG